MPFVSGLRSCYARVGRLVYFGRMLDKVRLHAAARLPPEYHDNLGIGFDGRCCSFLGVGYPGLRERILAGGADAEALAWCHERGGARSDDQCAAWNAFMMKLGWRDARAPILARRVVEYGLKGRPIETFFDLLEFDEGRDPVTARAWELRDSLAIVIMGVAGSGKTTVGRRLAETLGLGFRDADEFHPPANIAKMSAGLPLTDEDRGPWLEAIRDHLQACLDRGENSVTTCSALKEGYRRRLVPDPARVKFVYLAADFPLLLSRLEQRQGHFMKPGMLQSQLAALEPPGDALNLNAADDPDALVAKIRLAFGL